MSELARPDGQSPRDPEAGTRARRRRARRRGRRQGREGRHQAVPDDFGCRAATGGVRPGRQPGEAIRLGDQARLRGSGRSPRASSSGGSSARGSRSSRHRAATPAPTRAWRCTRSSSRRNDRRHGHVGLRRGDVRDRRRHGRYAGVTARTSRSSGCASTEATAPPSSS